MKCVLVVVIFLQGLIALSQPPKKYVLSCKGKQLDEILAYLDSRFGLKFSYDPELMSRYQVTVDLATDSKAQFLQAVFKDLPLYFKPTSTSILIIPDQANDLEGNQGNNNSPKVIKTISGYVRDAETGENLIGATIYERKSGKGTITNAYGFYSLSVGSNTVDLKVSFVGYKPVERIKTTTNNMTVNFILEYNNLMKAITVLGDESIEDTPQMGLINVPVNQISQAPMLLGEVDVLKTLQLLPGIQGGSEGTSGIYVRGGGPDQNLILIDGVPVYNASHLFGFLSVFNVDAINNVSVVKGGFPARYGGRLSSVIDISMKEGNNQKMSGIGSIGLVSSKFTIEGPIKGENTSFIVGARRTYLDILAKPFTKAFSPGYDAGYFFYDLHAKVNHRFSNKDRLYLSFYSGVDKLYNEDSYSRNYIYKSNIKWLNTIAALRWNHLFSPKLFANVACTFSNYKFYTEETGRKEVSIMDYNEVDEYYIKYGSGIKDLAVKVDFDYLPVPSHSIRFGAMGIHHSFDPSILTYKKDTDDLSLGQGSKIRGLEFSAYAEDDITVNDRLRLNLGIHSSLFNIRGKSFSSLQPRVSGRYLIGAKSSVKVSYSMMRQFVQLLTSSTSGYPNDLWVPVTDVLPPQRSWQVAFGASRSLGPFEVSIEGYYKEMDNLIAYREGASFFNSIDGETWEEKILSGAGDSYGLEFLVQRKTGRLSGWLGYTYSKTMRGFDGLNFGRRYPYKYDRTHDVSIVAIYGVNERIKLSGSWVYSTGIAVTIPDSSFPVFDPESPEIFSTDSYINNYTERNNYRYRSNHRLDVGISMRKKKPRGLRTWSFGAYNLYSRKNPFYTDLEIGPGGKKQFIQHSLFPWVIPYVDYSFEF